MKKPFVLWTLAIIITLGAAYYQRKTGPTYPYLAQINLNGQDINVSLPRSHDDASDCEISMQVPNGVSGKIVYRRFPTSDEWNEIQLSEKDNALTGVLPVQPAAGKLEYFIVFKEGETDYNLPENNPVVIRFKGSVPTGILIPHILLMFLTMLFSTLAGLMALVKNPKQKTYGLVTFITLILGGMILGPVVQKYAFDALWTGIPFGWDLTDNKTLIGFVFWVIAIIGNWKKERPGLTLLAAFMLLVIFSIPHSMFGSELDYETGNTIQGLILLPFLDRKSVV